MSSHLQTPARPHRWATAASTMSVGTEAQRQPLAQRVGEWCRWIESAEREPSLAELAARAGLSPGHYQRIFKAGTGLSPKAYAAAHRAARTREALRATANITEAIYAAGFGSDGRFYEQSTRLLGMTPSAFRRGAAPEPLYFAMGLSSLGSVLTASTSRGLAAILLGDDPEALLHELQQQFPNTELIGGDARYDSLVAQVIGLVETPASELALPLDIQGTAFQHRVWHALRQIPAGSTISYTELAQRIGAPKAVRAVAGACAANRLAVAIPCHRVVRHDGGLSGYRWGVDRKRKLLLREAAVRPDLLAGKD